MKQTILSLLCCLVCTASITAQEALWNRNRVTSPVVNADGTVTFNLSAPQATKVEVSGDFLRRPAEMQQTDGVWTFTTQKLDPELYSYSFRVDGMNMLDPSNIHVNRDVNSLTSIFIVSDQPGDKGDLYRVNDVPHGDVAKVWYDSPALKMKRRMTVYTPAGYDKGKNYPVLYLLHGAGGDEDAWTTLGRAAQILDNLIASGKAQPMLVVMPNGNTNSQAAPGAGSRSGGRGAASMDESFMDIVNYVDSHYKVGKGKKYRAVCGLSMGGGHSFAISKRFPDAFNYVGLFSAAVFMGGGNRQPTYEQLTTNKEVQEQLARLFAAKPALYWIAIGKTDFLYQQNADLRKYFDEKGYPYEYRESDGGHIWRNWRIYLSEFAQKIFK